MPHTPPPWSCWLWSVCSWFKQKERRWLIQRRFCALCSIICVGATLAVALNVSVSVLYDGCVYSGFRCRGEHGSSARQNVANLHWGLANSLGFTAGRAMLAPTVWWTQIASMFRMLRPARLRATARVAPYEKIAAGSSGGVLVIQSLHRYFRRGSGYIPYSYRQSPAHSYLL